MNRYPSYNITGWAHGPFVLHNPGWLLKVSKRAIQSRMRSEGTTLYEVTREFIRLKTRHVLTIDGRGIFGAEFKIPAGFELKKAGPPDLVSGFRQTGQKVEVNFSGELNGSGQVELILQKTEELRDSRINLEPVSVISSEKDAGNVVLATPRVLPRDGTQWRKACRQPMSGIFGPS